MLWIYQVSLKLLVEVSLFCVMFLHKTDIEQKMMFGQIRTGFAQSWLFGCPWKVLEFHFLLKSPYISVQVLETSFNFERSCLKSVFYCFLVVLLPNFILSCNSYQIFFRFYTHDQALEAIYQAQKMVLGDNLLKVSTGSGSLSIRPS